MWYQSRSGRDHNGKVDMELIQKQNDRNEFRDTVIDKKRRRPFVYYVELYVNFIQPPVGRRAERMKISQPDGPYDYNDFLYFLPICTTLILTLELICYFLNQHLPHKEPNKSFGVVADLFGFDPNKKQEYWRFLTYMFVHIRAEHLIANLFCQIVLGFALEIKNAWWRILALYIAGVVAGSLITSIVDSQAFLVGASGGVYTIITAHISFTILNWGQMPYPKTRLFAIIAVIGIDVSFAISNRYYVQDLTAVSYSAHICGALVGFILGIRTLKIEELTQKKKYLCWAAFVVYVLLMGVVLFLSITNKTLH